MKSVSLGVEYFSTATTATTDTATTTDSAINPGTTSSSFITAANFITAAAAAAATDTSIRVTKTEFLLKTPIQYKADK